MHKTYNKKLVIISTIGVTLCILLWASSSAILIHSIEKKVKEIEVQHTVLINTERLSYLNEKLTNLSQNYFNTQNKKWLKEHSDYTKEYKSIEAKTSNYNLKIFNDWYKHINADSIIILENIAFKLAEDNHFDKALKIINSKKYLNHKTNLSNSYKSILYNLEDGYFGLQNNLNNLIKDSDELWLFLSILILLVSILLFISLNSIFRFIKELKKSKEKENSVLKNLSQLNNSLAASKKNQENLLLSLGKGIVVLDAEANIIDSNTLFQDIIGYSKNELSYLSIPQLIHPEDYERSQKYFQELKDIGYYSEYEGRILNKNGDYIWVSVSSTAIIENNVFCGSRDIVRDISYEKATEGKLKVMNNVIAHITTNTEKKIGDEYFTSIIKLLNKSLNIDYSFIAKYNKEENTATTEYLCYDNEIIDNFSYSLKDTPCDNVITSNSCCVPNFVQELFPHDSLLIQMGINGYLGIAIKNSKDECTHILVSLSKRPIEDIEYHSRILENIGYSIKKEIERTELLKTFIDQEIQFKTIVENSTPIIFSFDKSGQILLSEGKMLKNLGLEPGQLVGQNVFELYQESPYIISKLKSALKGQTYEGVIELGNLFFEVYYTPLKDAKKNISGVVGMCSDITEKVKSEKELAERELRFKTIFDHAPDSVFLIGIEGNERGIITDANKVAHITHGYNVGELIGKSILDIDVPQSSSKSEERIKRIQQGETLTFEVEHYRKDGSKIPIEVTATQIIINEKARILAFDRDISNRQNLLYELKSSEEKHRNIFNSFVDIYYEENTDGIIEVISPSVKKILGYEIDQILGKKIKEFLNPVNEWSEILNKLKKDRTVRGSKINLINNKGKEISVELALNNRIDKKGNITGISGSIRDISDFERNKAYLKESQSAANIGTWDWDLLSGKITWSDEHFKIFGAPPQSFSPTKDEFDNYLSADEKLKVNNVINKSLESGESFNLKFQINRKDNTKRIVWSKGYTIRDSQEKVVRLYGTIQDISEIHDIEAKLNEKETLLKEIHHRVKNNLQVVSSLLSLQAAQLKDKSIASVFHQSQNRITAMALVHEHLYNSKELSSVNINSYFQSLIANLSDSYESESITINQYFPDIEISLDLATPTGLIINEVVSNSFKYAFTESTLNPTISILLHPTKKGEYVLTLKDNGLGIPDIRRAAKSKSLGMKLIHTLCRQIDASLDIWSEVNKGVKYEITFKK